MYVVGDRVFSVETKNHLSNFVVETYHEGCCLGFVVHCLLSQSLKLYNNVIIQIRTNIGLYISKNYFNLMVCINYL